MGVILFGLLLLDFVGSSWVLGPWYYIFNGFLLPSLVGGFYYWLKV